MTSRKMKTSRKLSFQTLEDRSLMAGNVTAAVQNHAALVVTGDNQDNAIEIQQVGDGQFKILVIDGTTKINGQTTATFFRSDGRFQDQYERGQRHAFDR